MSKILAVDLENNKPFEKGEQVLIKDTVKHSTEVGIYPIETRVSTFTPDGMYNEADTEPTLFHCKEIDLCEYVPLGDYEKLEKDYNNLDEICSNRIKKLQAENEELSEVIEKSTEWGKEIEALKAENEELKNKNIRATYELNIEMENYNKLAEQNTELSLKIKDLEYKLELATPKKLVKKEVWRIIVDGYQWEHIYQTFKEALNGLVPNENEPDRWNEVEIVKEEIEVEE